MNSNNSSGNSADSQQDALAQKILQMMDRRELLRNRSELVIPASAPETSNSLVQETRIQQQSYMMPNTQQLPNLQTRVLGCNDQGHVYIVNNNIGFGNNMVHYQMGNIQNQYEQSHYQPNASMPFNQNQFVPHFSPSAAAVRNSTHEGQPAPIPYRMNPGHNQYARQPAAICAPHEQPKQMTQTAGPYFNVPASTVQHRNESGFNQYALPVANSAPAPQPTQIMVGSNFNPNNTFAERSQLNQTAPIPCGVQGPIFRGPVETITMNVRNTNQTIPQYNSSPHPIKQQVQRAPNTLNQSRSINEETNLNRKSLQYTATLRPIRPSTTSRLNPEQTVHPTSVPVSISRPFSFDGSKSVSTQLKLNSDQQQSQSRSSLPITTKPMNSAATRFIKIAPRPKPTESIARQSVIVNEHTSRCVTPITVTSYESRRVDPIIIKVTKESPHAILANLQKPATVRVAPLPVTTNCYVVRSPSTPSGTPASKPHTVSIIKPNESSEISNANRSIAKVFKITPAAATAPRGHQNVVTIPKLTASVPKPLHTPPVIVVVPQEPSKVFTGTTAAFNIPKASDQSKAAPSSQSYQSNFVKYAVAPTMTTSTEATPNKFKLVDIHKLTKPAMDAPESAVRSPSNLTIPIGSNSPLRKSQPNQNEAATTSNSSMHQKQCENDSAGSAHIQKTAAAAADNQETSKKLIIAKVEHFLQGSVKQKELDRILSLMNQAVEKTSGATVSKSTPESDGANNSKTAEQLNDEVIMEISATASGSSECELASTPTNKTTTRNEAEMPGPSGEKHKASTPLKSSSIKPDRVTVDKEKKKGMIHFICMHNRLVDSSKLFLHHNLTHS